MHLSWHSQMLASTVWSRITHATHTHTHANSLDTQNVNFMRNNYYQVAETHTHTHKNTKPATWKIEIFLKKSEKLPEDDEVESTTVSNFCVASVIKLIEKKINLKLVAMYYLKQEISTNFEDSYGFFLFLQIKLSSKLRQSKGYRTFNSLS